MGGIPPELRNPRTPTGAETPASSLERPAAIPDQNRHKFLRCQTGDRPGQHNLHRVDRSDFRFQSSSTPPRSGCCDDQLNLPCDLVRLVFDCCPASGEASMPHLPPTKPSLWTTTYICPLSEFPAHQSFAKNIVRETDPAAPGDGLLGPTWMCETRAVLSGQPCHSGSCRGRIGQQRYC